MVIGRRIFMDSKSFSKSLHDYKIKLGNISVNDQKIKENLSFGKIQGSLTGYASIDKPWLKYYDLLDNNIVLPNKSIYEFARESNENNLDNIAIDMRVSSNDFKEKVKISYRDFFDRIHSMAKASSALGIKPDEIVPILLPNLPEARTFIYSNSFIGATSYPISPLLPEKNLESIIKENNIKRLVIYRGFFDKYKKVLNDCNLDGIVFINGTESLFPSNENIMDEVVVGDNILSWSEYMHLGESLKETIVPYYKKDHIAAIIGTSGTTGTSKGVCLTDDNVNAAAIEYRDGKFFEGKFLDALLPSIGYGISMLHYQVVNGHYTYLVPELVTDKIAQLIQATKPDVFPGGPVHYINLLQSEEYKNGTLHRGKNYISGGASLSSEVEKKLNKVDKGYTENGVNNDLLVRQGYGLSENVATGSYSKRGAYKFGSIGIPLPYSCVGIFKPDTDEELKYNELGEICVTGPTVMKGYLNNQEETGEVIKIHRDGKRWVHTKDIGYMDEEGHLFHVERIKNIFMRTGFNVHPNTVAEFINTLPYVQNSYVMGFDHPTQQCVPVAFIVLNKNLELSEEEVLEEIKSMCFKNLEETSVPYEYVFVDELPINVGGKIDGLKLKEESKIDYMEGFKKLSKVRK